MRVSVHHTNCFSSLFAGLMKLSFSLFYTGGLDLLDLTSVLTNDYP